MSLGRINADWQSTPELPVWQGAIPISNGRITLEPTAATQSTKRIQWTNGYWLSSASKYIRYRISCGGKEDVPSARREIVTASQHLLRSWLSLKPD